MHTKSQFHLSIIGLIVLFSVTASVAQTWEESVESNIIRGRIYRLAWETAVMAEADLCDQLPKHLKTVPHKLAYYQGIYAFQQGKVEQAKERFHAFLDPEKIKNKIDLFFDLAQLWSDACEGKTLPKEPPQTVEAANRLRWKSERGYLQARLGSDPAQGYKTCQEILKEAEKEEEAGKKPALDIFRKHLGYAALREGHLEQADEMFRAIDHSRPEYTDVYGQVDFFDKTTAPLSLDFFDPAILQHRAEYFFKKAAAQAAQKAEGGDVRGKYWLGVCKRELGGPQLDEAIQLLQAVESARADAQLSTLASVQLGACYHLKGRRLSERSRNDMAAPKWGQAANASSPAALDELGETYMELNVNLDKAVPLFQRSQQLLRALPEHKKKPEWWFYENSDDFKQYTWNLAFAYLKTNQPKAARETLEYVYLPDEKNLLDSPDEDSPRRQLLNLRRHLNLAQLGRCYLDYTRYKEMYSYIYFGEMLPKPGYYPETYQLYPCLRWLDLLKAHQPKAIVQE